MSESRNTLPHARAVQVPTTTSANNANPLALTTRAIDNARNQQLIEASQQQQQLSSKTAYSRNNQAGRQQQQVQATAPLFSEPISLYESIQNAQPKPPVQESSAQHLLSANTAAAGAHQYHFPHQQQDGCLPDPQITATTRAHVVGHLEGFKEKEADPFVEVCLEFTDSSDEDDNSVTTTHRTKDAKKAAVSKGNKLNSTVTSKEEPYVIDLATSFPTVHNFLSLNSASSLRELAAHELCVGHCVSRIRQLAETTSTATSLLNEGKGGKEVRRSSVDNTQLPPSASASERGSRQPSASLMGAYMERLNLAEKAIAAAAKEPQQSYDQKENQDPAASLLVSSVWDEERRLPLPQHPVIAAAAKELCKMLSSLEGSRLTTRYASAMAKSTYDFINVWHACLQNIAAKTLTETKMKELLLLADALEHSANTVADEKALRDIASTFVFEMNALDSASGLALTQLSFSSSKDALASSTTTTSTTTTAPTAAPVGLLHREHHDAQLLRRALVAAAQHIRGQSSVPDNSSFYVSHSDLENPLSCGAMVKIHQLAAPPNSDWLNGFFGFNTFRAAFRVSVNSPWSSSILAANNFFRSVNIIGERHVGVEKTSVSPLLGCKRERDTADDDYDDNRVGSINSSRLANDSNGQENVKIKDGSNPLYQHFYDTLRRASGKPAHSNKLHGFSQNVSLAVNNAKYAANTGPLPAASAPAADRENPNIKNSSFEGTSTSAASCCFNHHTLGRIPFYETLAHALRRESEVLKVAEQRSQWIGDSESSEMNLLGSLHPSHNNDVVSTSEFLSLAVSNGMLYGDLLTRELHHPPQPQPSGPSSPVFGDSTSKRPKKIYGLLEDMRSMNLINNDKSQVLSGADLSDCRCGHATTSGGDTQDAMLLLSELYSPTPRAPTIATVSDDSDNYRSETIVRQLCNTCGGVVRAVPSSPTVRQQQQQQHDPREELNVLPAVSGLLRARELSEIAMLAVVGTANHNGTTTVFSSHVSPQQSSADNSASVLGYISPLDIINRLSPAVACGNKNELLTVDSHRQVVTTTRAITMANYFYAAVNVRVLESLCNNQNNNYGHCNENSSFGRPPLSVYDWRTFGAAAIVDARKKCLVIASPPSSSADMKTTIGTSTTGFVGYCDGVESSLGFDEATQNMCNNKLENKAPPSPFFPLSLTDEKDTPVGKHLPTRLIMNDLSMMPMDRFSTFPSQYAPGDDYLASTDGNGGPTFTPHIDLRPSMRVVLNDWLLEVSVKYQLQDETFMLAAAIVDAFLANYHKRLSDRRKEAVAYFLEWGAPAEAVVNALHDVDSSVEETVWGYKMALGAAFSRHNLQLLGAASLMIASKVEEIYPPSSADFVHVTDRAVSLDALLEMEKVILTQLNFEITFPSVLMFAQSILSAAAVSSFSVSDEGGQSEGQYQEQVACNPQMFIAPSPSTVALRDFILSAARSSAQRESKKSDVRFETRYFGQLGLRLQTCLTNTCSTDDAHAFAAHNNKYVANIGKGSHTTLSVSPPRDQQCTQSFSSDLDEGSSALPAKEDKKANIIDKKEGGHFKSSRGNLLAFPMTELNYPVELRVANILGNESALSAVMTERQRCSGDNSIANLSPIHVSGVARFALRRMLSQILGIRKMRKTTSLLTAVGGKNALSPPSTCREVDKEGTNLKRWAHVLGEAREGDSSHPTNTVEKHDKEKTVRTGSRPREAQRNSPLAMFRFRRCSSSVARLADSSCHSRSASARSPFSSAAILSFVGKSRSMSQQGRLGKRQKASSAPSVAVSARRSQSVVRPRSASRHNLRRSSMARNSRGSFLVMSPAANADASTSSSSLSPATKRHIALGDRDPTSAHGRTATPTASPRVRMPVQTTGDPHLRPVRSNAGCVTPPRPLAPTVIENETPSVRHRGLSATHSSIFSVSLSSDHEETPLHLSHALANVSVQSAITAAILATPERKETGAPNGLSRLMATYYDGHSHDSYDSQPQHSEGRMSLSEATALLATLGVEAPSNINGAQSDGASTCVDYVTTSQLASSTHLENSIASYLCFLITVRNCYGEIALPSTTAAAIVGIARLWAGEALFDHNNEAERALETLTSATARTTSLVKNIESLSEATRNAIIESLNENLKSTAAAHVRAIATQMAILFPTAAVRDAASHIVGILMSERKSTQPLIDAAHEGFERAYREDEQWLRAHHKLSVGSVLRSCATAIAKECNSVCTEVDNRSRQIEVNPWPRHLLDDDEDVHYFYRFNLGSQARDPRRPLNYAERFSAPCSDSVMHTVMTAIYNAQDAQAAEATQHRQRLRRVQLELKEAQQEMLRNGDNGAYLTRTINELQRRQQELLESQPLSAPKMAIFNKYVSRRYDSVSLLPIPRVVADLHI